MDVFNWWLLGQEAGLQSKNPLRQKRKKKTVRDKQEMKIVIIISICWTLIIIAIKPNGIRDFLFILFIETCLVLQTNILIGVSMPLSEYKTSILITCTPNLARLWQFAQTNFPPFLFVSILKNENYFEIIWRTSDNISSSVKHLSGIQIVSFPKWKTHDFNWCNFQYNQIYDIYTIRK